MKLTLMILFQVLLIALNAIFACAEIAVLSTNETKMKKMAEEGDKRAKKLLGLTKQPARFLATIQVAITLSGFLGSAFAAENFAGPIVGLLMPVLPEGFPEATLNAIVVVLITIVLSFFTLIFGELVPKRVAMRKAESLSLSLSRPLSAIAKLFFPLVWILTVSTNGVLRLMGIDPDQNEQEVSEEDILMLVDDGAQKGAVDSTEHEIIQNVFAFDDLTAGEIATHRTEVAMLWEEDSPEQWDEVVHENRFTFYPVCGESQDNIIGVLNAKDYFRLDDRTASRETVMEKAVKPPYLVPEGVKADVLLRNMKHAHVQFAIVIDEYGGMAGIVTMADLLEQLVGDISDDDDAQPASSKDASMVKNEDGSWIIPGTTPIGDVEKELGVELTDEDSDTFGGLVFAELGTIPPDGTTCELDVRGLHVEILDVVDHQMDAARVTILPPETEEGEESEKSDEEE